MRRKDEGSSPLSGEKASSGGVQSLHRAMNILTVVAQSKEGIGLTELSKAIELHSSTTFHLAKTLVTLNLLKQNGDSKRYRIGAQLFSLATGASHELELLDTAALFLKKLSEVTGESAHLAVFSGVFDVVIIDKVESSASIIMAERIGTTRPAHATAIGKVLLSGLSDSELEEVLRDRELEAITPRTIVDVGILRQAVHDAGKNRIAFDHGEMDVEVRCLAAPVFDFRRRIVAAIGISAPSWRLNHHSINSSAEILKNVASELSLNLGCPEEKVVAE